MSETEDKVRLSLSLCVIWETERPLRQRIRQSPVFTFENCEWYLKFECEYSSYYLYIVLTTKQEINPKFMVKTCFLNPQLNGVRFFYQRREVTSSNEQIARISISEVEESIPNFNTAGIFKIECTFEEIDSSTQSFSSGGHKSVYFPLKTESLLNNSPECSSSISKDQALSFENLSKDLEGMLDNKILPDVDLVVGEASIPCHRAVLASRSKVFAAMFQHEMTESTSGVLEIKDIDLSTIEVFLKYLYCGKIPDDLAEDMLVKLFETGDKYEVDVLKKLCSSELMKNINDGNCLSYLSLAEVHIDQEFKDAVVAYIVKDDRLMTTQEWIQFSSENLKLANEVYLKYFEIKDRKRRKVN